MYWIFKSWDNRLYSLQLAIIKSFPNIDREESWHEKQILSNAVQIWRKSCETDWHSSNTPVWWSEFEAEQATEAVPSNFLFVKSPPKRMWGLHRKSSTCQTKLLFLVLTTPLNWVRVSVCHTETKGPNVVSSLWNPALEVMDWEAGVFRRGLGHEDGAFVNGMSALRKEGGTEPHPLPKRGQSRKLDSATLEQTLTTAWLLALSSPNNRLLELWEIQLCCL